MPGMIAKVALLTLVLIVATSADAQTTHRKREQHRSEPPAPAAPLDKRDSVVAATGAFNGRPFWLALAQCGGVYFKLNILYTDAAVRARVIKPDPRANSEFTKELNDAIKTATIYFNGAEHFLMTERGVERDDAVLTYDGPSRAAGERLKSIETALAAARACPVLYQACREAHPKECSEPLAPSS
jgi:hypothetical protein